jgi:hypothetical protein
MKVQLLSLTAGAAFFAAVTAANAADPVRLSPTQLDEVTAGLTVSFASGSSDTSFDATASEAKSKSKTSAKVEAKAGDVSITERTRAEQRNSAAAIGGGSFAGSSAVSAIASPQDIEAIGGLFD